MTLTTEMRLHKERKRAGLTQAALALLAGVPQASISKMERGILLKPTHETLERLAKALNKRGCAVEPRDIAPRPQPSLVKGARKRSA